MTIIPIRRIQTANFSVTVDAISLTDGFSVRAYVHGPDGAVLAEDSIDGVELPPFPVSWLRQTRAVRDLLRFVIAEARAAMAERQARYGSIRLRQEAEQCPA